MKGGQGGQSQQSGKGRSGNPATLDTPAEDGGPGFSGTTQGVVGTTQVQIQQTDSNGQLMFSQSPRMVSVDSLKSG